MDAHTRNAGIAFGTLLASSGTLLCCVLPALLVSLGAGATMVWLVATFPQLVWLSRHKSLVFVLAGLILVAAASLLWRARSLPCPTDPAAARACSVARRISVGLYLAAVAAYLLGATFAYLLPMLG